MIVYSKFNNDRKKAFQLITKIEKNKNAISVIKESIYQESDSFLNSFISKYKYLIKNNFCITPIKPLKVNDRQIKFDYKNGPTLEYLLFIYLKNKDKLKFIELVDDYYQKISENNVIRKVDSIFFNQIFGRIDSNYKTKCMNIGCLDLNFDNLIIDDQKWMLIDYEWIFEKVNIPTQYVFFRAITYFYNNYIEYNPDLLIPLSFFYEKYNISDDDQDRFIRFEYNFQTYVNGIIFFKNTSYEQFQFNFENLKNNLTNSSRYIVDEKNSYFLEVKKLYREKELIIKKHNLEMQIIGESHNISKIEQDLDNIKSAKAFKLWRLYYKIIGK